MANKYKWINKQEDRISVLQGVGLILIWVGILSLIISSLINVKYFPSIPAIISISFFIVMLGVAFAFPSLLEGNDGLSTMRITVFMMTNIICMLLLKIGWADKINSLSDIGLNQWWMGVIAFIFGAKATQSYFESKMWQGQNEASGSDAVASSYTTLSTLSKDIILKAVNDIKNRKDKDVLGVGYLPKIENGVMKYYVHLNVDNEETKEIYRSSYTVKDNNNEDVAPPMTIVVTNVAQKHSSRLPGTGISNITGKNGTGTFGCVVIETNTNSRCILSCQHVLKDDDKDYNSPDRNPIIKLSDGSNDSFANHISGFRTNDIDAGLARLNDQSIGNKNLGLLIGERDTTDNDIVFNKKISFKGFDPEYDMMIPQYGVIVNNSFDVDLDYNDGNGKFTLKDTIVLSSNSEDFHTISTGGYSGSLVVDEDRYIIGIVVGGDNKFTYAIPINKIKTILNFKILK